MKVKDFLLILICVLNCSTINEQFEDTVVVAIMCICHSTQNLMFLSASLMGDALYFCCHMMSFVNANLPRYPFGIFMINPFGLLLGLSCDVKRLRVLNFPGISSFVSSSSNTYLLPFSNIPFLFQHHDQHKICVSRCMVGLQPVLYLVFRPFLS